MQFRPGKYGNLIQILISLALIAVASISCFVFVDYIGYKVVALILLLVVSIQAMLFDIIAVLITAVLSALIWNYFFIPPILDLYINTTEDGLMFAMYFVIALINAVLTFKIRQAEKKVQEKEGREKTIKLYNTLLNSLSHELRTPISAIIASIDAIRDSDSKVTEENKNVLYTEIATAGMRLNGQVENLLNMSRLEAGVLQPKLDWCDINELIFSVIETNKEDARNHKVKYEPNPNMPLVKIDSGLMEHVVHNILHNALQYTPIGTTVTIETHHAVGKCWIVITDSGDGFPEDETDTVFEKFYRLPKSAPGGTGLGLSIVKGFVEAHHGTVRLENIRSGGARFTIGIPAEKALIRDFVHD